MDVVSVALLDVLFSVAQIALLDVLLDLALVALLDVLFGVSQVVLVDVLLDVVQVDLFEVLLDVILVALLDVLFEDKGFDPHLLSRRAFLAFCRSAIVKHFRISSKVEVNLVSQLTLLLVS